MAMDRPRSKSQDQLTPYKGRYVTRLYVANSRQHVKLGALPPSRSDVLNVTSAALKSASEAATHSRQQLLSKLTRVVIRPYRRRTAEGDGLKEKQKYMSQPRHIELT